MYRQHREANVQDPPGEPRARSGGRRGRRLTKEVDSFQPVLSTRFPSAIRTLPVSGHGLRFQSSRVHGARKRQWQMRLRPGLRLEAAVPIEAEPLAAAVAAVAAPMPVAAEPLAAVEAAAAAQV